MFLQTRGAVCALPTGDRRRRRARPVCETGFGQGSNEKAGRFCTRLEDHDGRADARKLIDALQIVVVQSDAAVRDVPSQQSRVERPVDEVALSESQRVFAKHARFHPIGLIAGNGQAFFDEGPIRFDPDGIHQLGLNVKFAPWRIEDPLAGGFARLVEYRSASCGGKGVQHDSVAPFDEEVVSRRVDDDVWTVRNQLRELPCQGLVTGLQGKQGGRIADGRGLGLAGLDLRATLSKTQQEKGDHS